jgi:hypothetical protein
VPYSTGKSDQCPTSKPFAVLNKDTGKVVPGGCHATQADAQKHLAALKVNVEEAQRQK